MKKKKLGGRPKLANYQKRTKCFRVMFTENDYIYIQSKAQQAGLSVNEFCHQAAMGCEVGQRISPEMVSAIRDLSGIANNVNQIAHQMHIYGLEAVKQQGFSIISEVSRIITQVKNNNHDSEDKTRADFGGIVNYANDQKNKKKSAILLAYEGVCAISNKTIADSFQIQASMRPKVKSSVKHVSLAFSPQDTIRFSDDEKGDTLMVEIAKKWMEQMGISNTQYIIARHHDTEHPHCHIVFNRIDNDGNLISDSNERIRNAKVCRALTKEYKLYFAPKNSKARNKSRLRPHQLRKYNLRSAALDALAVSRSWNDFLGILKGQGIDMRFNHAENSDKIRGISFCMDEFSIAGSKLDCDLSFNSLCVTLGNVTTELIIQPHQAITSSGGGGTSNEQGWRDDKNKDSQRNEPFYNPSKRRR
ncbi:plasmid mobilization relaxosome protein MobC [Bacteroides uniformis]|uniref:Plasmid mobilization relaxosome protein MobC n=2 Tax=Bacteroides uniformis TaxID=820 RepID=A0A414BFL1_BACUN|nr:plasmid mobilization relaxosome protein MobC [Bacteroides uniformis]